MALRINCAARGSSRDGKSVIGTHVTSVGICSSIEDSKCDNKRPDQKAAAQPTARAVFYAWPGAM
jgi:hypothetical protein